MEKCTHRYDNTKDSAYQIDIEGFLCFKNQIYIPNQLQIKKDIFKGLHDNPYFEHLGYHNLITLSQYSKKNSTSQTSKRMQKTILLGT